VRHYDANAPVVVRAKPVDIPSLPTQDYTGRLSISDDLNNQEE
jgi:hypothetical protein